MIKDIELELNILQSIKEFTLKCNGSTITEGEYKEIEDNSSNPVPFILIDSHYFWLEYGMKKVIVNWL